MVVFRRLIWAIIVTCVSMEGAGTMTTPMTVLSDTTLVTAVSTPGVSTTLTADHSTLPGTMTTPMKVLSDTTLVTAVSTPGVTTTLTADHSTLPGAQAAKSIKFTIVIVIIIGILLVILTVLIIYLRFKSIQQSYV
uniref:uncharacterized protein isoform X2 n=1 Tax=Pristiophorus japonicus TaxID=55135 RepID=UPI00398E3970